MHESILAKSASGELSVKGRKVYVENETLNIAADPVMQYMTKEQLQKNIAQTRKSMEKAAKDLDFMEAARLRDELIALEKLLREKY